MGMGHHCLHTSPIARYQGKMPRSLMGRCVVSTMKPDTYPPELFEQVKYILGCAVNFFTKLETQAATVRTAAKKTYGRLLDAHMFLTGIIQSALLRKNLVPGKTSEPTAHRLQLIASFIQGIGLTVRSNLEVNPRLR